MKKGDAVIVDPTTANGARFVGEYVRSVGTGHVRVRFENGAEADYAECCVVRAPEHDVTLQSRTWSGR
jgi:hypothetical protein